MAGANELVTGTIRDQMENALRITEELKVILDKIRHVHKFFEGLQVMCSALDEVSTHTIHGLSWP